MKTILLIFCLTTLLRVSNAQPPNENYGDYSLIFVDEFDTLFNNTIYSYNDDPVNPPYTAFFTDVDLTKWRSWPPYKRDCNSPAYRDRYFQNAEIDTTGSGKLILTIRNEDKMGQCVNNNSLTAKEYNYTSQMLFSNKEFKYGYYEIRFRIPQPPSTYPAREEIYGIGPNFWLFNAKDNCDVSWSELDIFEIDGCHYFDEIPYQNLVTHNVHFEYCKSSCNTCSNSTHYSKTIKILQDGIFDDNNFHKIGMRWLPNSISFYIDDNLSYIYNNIVSPDKLIAMPLVIDINFPTFDHTLNDFLWLPYKYEVDYVKVWSLKNNCRNPDIEICTNIPFDIDGSYNVTENTTIYNYDNSKVYNQIEVSGENCDPIVIEPGINIDMKANKRIILKLGFHAKAGSKFKASIQNCETIVE